MVSTLWRVASETHGPGADREPRPVKGGAGKLHGKPAPVSSEHPSIPGPVPIPRPATNQELFLKRTNDYAGPEDVGFRVWYRTAAIGCLWPYRTGVMQDAGYGLPRTPPYLSLCRLGE